MALLNTETGAAGEVGVVGTALAKLRLRFCKLFQQYFLLVFKAKYLFVEVSLWLLWLIFSLPLSHICDHNSGYQAP